MRSPVLFTLFSFAMPLVLAGSHGLGARHHHEVAKRAGGDVELHKRFSNARFTFYDAGLGACGKTNSGSDFIVALNTPQYGYGSPGPQCFKTITITANGKTTRATIMDECPGCPWGGLDMSRGLFTFFAAESAGVIYGTWSFGDSSGGGGNGDSKTTTTTHKSTPTTTRKSPTTTSTRKKTTSSTSSTSKSSSSSSSTHTSHTSTSSITSTTSIDYAAGVASGLAIPTGTATDTSGSIIEHFYQAFVNLGGLVVAAAN